MIDPRTPSRPTAGRARLTSSVAWRGLGASLLAAQLAAMPSGTSHAAFAPSEAREPEAGSEDAELGPTLEDARLMVGRDLYARGNDHFANLDYAAAIEAWEQMLLLMPEQRAALRAPLAHAHHQAYGIDHDPGHLEIARDLFADQLASSSPDDAARKDLEAVIDAIDAERLVLEEAKAKAKAEREERIRRREALIREQALAQAEASHHRNVRKIYFGVGGSLASLGAGTLVATTVFLSLGARAEREGEATARMTGVAEARYRELLAEGSARNRAAVVTGVIGGVLVLAGGSLLTMATVRHTRVIRRLERLAMAPTAGGVQLRF